MPKHSLTTASLMVIQLETLLKILSKMSEHCTNSKVQWFKPRHPTSLNFQTLILTRSRDQAPNWHTSKNFTRNPNRDCYRFHVFKPGVDCASNTSDLETKSSASSCWMIKQLKAKTLKTISISILNLHYLPIFSLHTNTRKLSK